ncbi:ubiquitin-conjugating enzyme E2 G1 isoform X1 [Acipenser oxyrinchus oxyrinchus]|uniref:Ubiquitin-conjugating enzyme E2 G1 n=1 Tax=Acipenser oxyrinchus oxyrinchus TaxID=40147 RepID=A0AAD8FVH6_ACIOX|nr:ubiquitin-conjugating enzyme E2 G1 isoform X1 [Acipenser oxyrinchus oxyrinchus]
MTEPQSALLLRRQLAELNKNPVEGFSAGLIDDNDLYRWEVLIIGPPDTLYEGGVFKAHLTFPKDYPLRPPKMKFITEIWHPNVDKNGDVCISILHEPGEDKYGYEKPEERWLPIHTVETIMISVISMLADPNGDSPANVDAAKEWREDRNGEFKRKLVASLFSGSPIEKQHGTVPALYPPIAGLVLTKSWQTHRLAAIERKASHQ